MYNMKLDREANGIGRRIALARKRKRMTVQKLCDEMLKYGIEITRTAVGKWERGESMPNAYQLLALSFALGIEDCLYWFSGEEKKPPVLNEEGLQKVEDYISDLIASGKYRPTIQSMTKSKIIEMPVSRLRASAGTGSFLDEGGFEIKQMIATQVPGGADFGIYISGDSMEPYYHDGDIAWVQECRTLSVGDVGIFSYDGDGYIKEYDEQWPDDEHRDEYTDSEGVLHKQPVLRSFNTAYKPKFIQPGSLFRIVGKVLN